jgi:diguanylate cyclase (GGDEF)-like protein
VATSTTSFSRYAVLLTNGLDEYRMRLAEGMLPILTGQGISLLIHAEDPFAPGLSPTMADMIRRTPPCGVIATEGATGTYAGEFFDLIFELGLPVISVAMPGMGRVNIRSDCAAATRDLMAHLLDERGVRRPVFIRGTKGQKDAVDRETLVRAELAARGLTLTDEMTIDGDFAVDTAYTRLRALLAHRRDLDAVIASNDLSAIGAWRALTDAGLRVPDDVLISGFDDEEVARINWPGLTSVDSDQVGQGAAAAEALLAELDRAEPERARLKARLKSYVLDVSGLSGCAPDGAQSPTGEREVVLPGRLMIRGTTCGQEESVDDERERAVGMARASQRHLAEQDSLLFFNQAMMRCATIPDLVEALTSTHLDRLGIKRCILAVHDLAPDGRITGTRLLMDYRDGAGRPLPAQTVPLHTLLQHEHGDEILVFQPLSTADRQLGYVLYEHTHWIRMLSETLRIDLSRSLGAAIGAQELREYAQTLEDQVERRTRELKKEVTIRRRTEDELQRLNLGLQRSLMIDGLTGIANRAAFERHFDLCGPSGTEGEEMSLLFVDVDHFKAYNDLYGHVMGDEALRQVADSLARSIRYKPDLACRWGGEEFAVLLPGTGAEGADRVAQRFRKLLAELKIPHSGSNVSEYLTASVGIAYAVSSPGMTSTEFVEAADRALYTAKMLGRDCVYPPVPDGRQILSEPDPGSQRPASDDADHLRTPASGLDS